MGFCEPSPECGNAALPEDPCKVSEYFYKAVKEKECMSYPYNKCSEVPKNVKMPVYQGSEQSVELQSTAAFKDCEGAAAGEEGEYKVLHQVIKVGQCISDACTSSK